MADFVLSRFSREEKANIENAILDAALAAETIIAYDIDKAMNQFNSREGSPDKSWATVHV